jgi:hypothetical protein
MGYAPHEIPLLSQSLLEKVFRGCFESMRVFSGGFSGAVLRTT